MTITIMVMFANSTSGRGVGSDIARVASADQFEGNTKNTWSICVLVATADAGDCTVMFQLVSRSGKMNACAVVVSVAAELWGSVRPVEMLW